MDLIEDGHFDATFVSTNHHSITPMSWDVLLLPVTKYWDIHAVSDITDTKKLKSFLPLCKGHWSFHKMTTKSIISKTQHLLQLWRPKLPLISHVFSVKQAQIKLILNSSPAKSHSKKCRSCRSVSSLCSFVSSFFAPVSFCSTAWH